MTRIIIYSLLSLYVLAQLKPLAAIVNDVLAHTFFRVQHMATIHYENGKYHLHTELESIAKETGDTDKSNTPSKENTLKEIPQTITDRMKLLPPEHSTINNYFPSARQTCEGFARLLIHPPKANSPYFV